MLILLSNISSNAALIREMDAMELAEYLSQLETKVNDEKITPDELSNIRIAKQNFKQITGADWRPNK